MSAAALGHPPVTSAPEDKRNLLPYGVKSSISVPINELIPAAEAQVLAPSSKSKKKDDLRIRDEVYTNHLRSLSNLQGLGYDVS